MRHNIVSLKLKYITTVLPSTAVFFHGTYRGAKSVVLRNTKRKGKGKKGREGRKDRHTSLFCKNAS